MIGIIMLAGLGAHAAILKPDGDLLGEMATYSVHRGDSVYEIARRYDVGFVELLAANPELPDPLDLEEGTELTITGLHILPEGGRKGIVINLSAMRLFYFAADGTVMSFPIGVGMQGWETPTGVTKIMKKRLHPAWIPPLSIQEEDPELPDIIPAGPNNPLGQYALNLGWQNFIIHGTNQPHSIGKRASHGCIRLYPEDIATLYNAVEEGAPVTVIDTPYILGWKGDQLFLEVWPTHAQADAIAYSTLKPQLVPQLSNFIEEKVGKNAPIDWEAVGEAALKSNGVPTLIGRKLP